MLKTMSFSNIGTIKDDKLPDFVRDLESGYRDAMQGLSCVQGRLRAIPTLASLAALSTVIDELNTDKIQLLPDSTRKAYCLYKRVESLLETVNRVVEESDRYDALDQLAAEEATKNLEAADDD